MFGLDPSESARHAKEIFENQKVNIFFKRKKIDILELGAGLGRDTTYLAANSNLITRLRHLIGRYFSLKGVIRMTIFFSGLNYWQAIEKFKKRKRLHASAIPHWDSLCGNTDVFPGTNR